MSETVRLMFSEISGSYDLGNDVLSVGMHRSWKRRFVKLTGPKPGDVVLDVATGTGDIASIFAHKVGAEGKVIGVDFSAAMIDTARKREKNTAPNLGFEVGDVLDLRFEENMFDIATISFGIRNVDDPVAGLAEMRRVVKPGGRVAVMEFGQPKGFLSGCYRFYSQNILPIIGGIISGNRDAYSYLERTSAQFPSGEEFMAMMGQAGIRNVKGTPLMGGLAWMYIGSVE